MKKAIEIFVSLGAAVVIFGAWAKLLHRPYADFMLTVGLLTEAAIFVLYAVLEVSSKKSISFPENNQNTTELTAAIQSLESTIKKIFKNS